jgi:ketosteroid isomerase-like protein
MSQENVEIVRRAFDAAVREWDRTAAERVLDPAVEFHGTIGGIREGLVLRGLDELERDLHQEELEVWEERRFEAEKFIDRGDRVVVLMHEFRRGKGSGIEVEVDTAVVFDVGNGRVVRIQGYLDPVQALAAARQRE